MAIIVPVHQFELRYTPLLNFNNIIKEVASPFIPSATGFNYENEQVTKNSRLTLTFASDFCTILVSFDRIILRYEGDPSDLRKNNSIFEEPFLNLFNKIKAHKDFGKATNVLFYTIYIKPEESVTKESIIESFLKNNAITETANKIITQPSDASIILKKSVGDSQIQIQYGPYLGIDDLTSRNAVPVLKHIEKIDRMLGKMAEISFVDNATNYTFSKYKETVDKSNELMSKIQ